MEQDEARDRWDVADHDLVAGRVEAVYEPVPFPAELGFGLWLDVVILVEALSAGVRQGRRDDGHLGFLAVQVRIQHRAEGGPRSGERFAGWSVAIVGIAVDRPISAMIVGAISAWSCSI